MAAKLPEAGMVVLCIAVGCAEILKPLLSFLEGAPTRGPVPDAAVVFVTLTVPMAYLAGVILLYAPITAAAGTPVAVVVLAAFRQYVLLVCALLVLLSMASSLFPAAGGR